MKKQSLSLAGLTLLMANGAQAADQWTWLAGAEDDYQPQYTISLLMGQMDPGDNMDSDTVAGVELALNCPLLQPPSNRIRQQLSYIQYENNGVEIESIELNPHYVVEVTPGLEIGAGPGLGLVMVDTPNGDGNVFGLQLGLSAHFQGASPLFVGAEVRYQITGEDKFGAATESDVDNTRILLKVGYSL